MSALHPFERPLRVDRKGHGHNWMVDGNDTPFRCLISHLRFYELGYIFWELLFIDFWGIGWKNLLSYACCTDPPTSVGNKSSNTWRFVFVKFTWWCVLFNTSLIFRV
jgi:hypothetical protein